MNLKLCKDCIINKEIYIDDDDNCDDQQVINQWTIEEAEESLAICAINYTKRTEIEQFPRSIVYIITFERTNFLCDYEYVGFTSKGILRINTHIVLLEMFRRYNLKAKTDYFKKYEDFAERIQQGKSIFITMLPFKNLDSEGLFKETLIMRAESKNQNYNVSKCSNVMCEEDFHIGNGNYLDENDCFLILKGLESSYEKSKHVEINYNFLVNLDLSFIESRLNLNSNDDVDFNYLDHLAYSSVYKSVKIPKLDF